MKFKEAASVSLIDGLNMNEFVKIFPILQNYPKVIYKFLFISKMKLC